MIRKCHAHGRLHVRLERIATHRAVFQVASINQMWPKPCFSLAKISDLLFPDLAGMVNRGVSLIVCGLSERISVNIVFHSPSLRRSRAGVANKVLETTRAEMAAMAFRILGCRLSGEEVGGLRHTDSVLPRLPGSPSKTRGKQAHFPGGVGKLPGHASRLCFCPVELEADPCRTIIET
jgi:hypothetical protein